MRPEWDEIWMDFYTIKALLRPHSGRAVVVTRDNCQVLAVGYNGLCRWSK